jgi:ketosteroid isomerase-like protein
MPRSSLAAFTALWRAYGEGRLERSLDLIDDDCELVLLDGRTFQGHEGVRAWLADVRREWKTLTVSYSEVRELGADCVVGMGRISGFSIDGSRTVDLPLACAGEFRDGRLVWARAFTDAHEALAQARRRQDAATA